ncbi:MAG: fumarylacetoacetate hydrolase family protein [Oligoflexus sp.]
MKLGTFDNGTRDGRLAVVSKDLQRCMEVGDSVPTLQFALDHWEKTQPNLEAISQQLNADHKSGEPVASKRFIAPLPRAYEWIDGSAYINHIVLVRKARGAEPPETLKTDPLVYQGGSGVLLGHDAPVELANPEWGCDFESEVVVYLGDTPQGVSKKEAASCVRLVGICNDVSLRNLIPGELAKGFGFFGSKPASAFAPFVVTPDELGAKWQDGRLHLPLVTKLNGDVFGDPDAGPEMHFSFYDLIEFIARTRSFTAGTILGSGTVSNEDRRRGSSCLAEKRMIEKIDLGEIKTPFLQYGDQVEIEMVDPAGQSIFGQISQKVVPYKRA